MDSLKEGDFVIVTCKNGAVVAGSWGGTWVLRNEPVITVGKRSEYFKNVVSIEHVLEKKTVFDRHDDARQLNLISLLEQQYES
jgi:hypothetical protein